MERHWEQSSGNKADVKQVWGGIRLGRSTVTLGGNRTLGTQEVESVSETHADITMNHDNLSTALSPLITEDVNF